MPSAPVREVELRGAPWELLKILDGPGPYPVELVLEGPAGTGKTRGLGHVIHWAMITYPKLRVAVCRKTRASLTETFLKTWEEDVLPEDDPMLTGVSRAHRDKYTASNGSVLVPVGLDNPGRHYSSEWDIVACIEAWELIQDEWERWLRSLRNGRAPFNMLLGDLNPQFPKFWLHRRCDSGTTLCLFSKHADNPCYFDGDGSLTDRGARFMSALDQLTGVRRSRLRDGKRVASEGTVWETFDHDANVITPPRTDDGEVDYDALGIRWWIAGQDWGFTAPGAFLVAGVDGDGRIFIVAQIYRRGMLLEWWAEKVSELYREFDLTEIACDPARPDGIKSFNDRLAFDFKVPGLALGADNRKTTKGEGDMGGLDLVREGWRVAEDGRPRITILRDSLRFGRDAELEAKLQPCSLEEEIPSYVWFLDQAGNQKHELTDPKCPDHACDALRYLVMAAWRADRSPPPPRKYKPGTWGHVLGHAEVFKDG